MPGYADGAEPYGQYTARRFFVSPRWKGPAASERYDVAFVRVAPAARVRARSRRPEAPAGLPISFAASQTAALQARAYVFGYPALPPYTGLYPNYCAGPAASSATRKGSARMACAMTAGDSGGPWLTGFSPQTGHRHDHRRHRLQALRRPADALRHRARPERARPLPEGKRLTAPSYPEPGLGSAR